jgi:hypothetical protein
MTKNLPTWAIMLSDNMLSDYIADNNDVIW